MVMAACCGGHARNIHLFPPGANHLNIRSLMALMNNPVMLQGFGQGNTQQQKQQQRQQQQQGTANIPQAKSTTPAPKGQGQHQQYPLPNPPGIQTQPQTPPMTQQTQNQGSGQGQGQGQPQTQNAGQGRTQQAPVPAPSTNTQSTVNPMQQFMRYSSMFTDPMFLRYFQQFMRRIDMIKHKYTKGEFVPPKGLFPGGYVINADGSDAEVRDIYGRLHSIDGGVFQT
ncbi:POU domain, class 6, transcription factor 2-like [Haliotis cracherodii]|uniref:POU domain, class 6, transcription factor 2-like n=1 Tax=Haliotis cracherodii TaxID=6455 RepID=UPI0039EB23F8